MVMWKVILTKQANKDAKKLTAAGSKAQTETLLAILAENPYQPPSEKLKGIYWVTIHGESIFSIG